jgi:hypothetical protein
MHALEKNTVAAGMKIERKALVFLISIGPLIAYPVRK